MEAIEEFENKNGIPHDWINFAISRNPLGHWQRLERGEIKLDDEFFKGFSDDLCHEGAWRDYHVNFKDKARLKDIANPTQLGDPISLKAETSNSSPTDDDRGAASISQATTEPAVENGADLAKKPTLSKLAKDTTIGDPVSLEAEEVVISSQGRGHGKPASPLHDQNSSTNKAVATGDTPSPKSTKPQNSPPSRLPPIPTIDVSSLFWSMMERSRHPDPYIFPAIQRLSSLPNKLLLGAISNTIKFPLIHPYHTEVPDLRQYFSVFIASSEVGIRKPDHQMYELALKRLDAFDREHGGQGIKAEEVLFLDDIGENLKAAKECGIQTLKVVRGKTWRAVKELERITGLELMDEKTRRAKL